MAIENQPVNNVQWLHRDTLTANKYNPNAVYPLEMELLKMSYSQSFQFPAMYAAIVAIALTGLLVNSSLSILQSHIEGVVE